MILFWFVCIVFLFQFWCYIHNSKFIFRHIRHLYKYRFIEFIISCYELIRNRHGWQNQQRQKLAALRAKETKMISKTSKKSSAGRGNPTRCCPVLWRAIAVLVSVLVGAKVKFWSKLFTDKYKEKFMISCEIMNFLVETTGLEPVTSCVWRYVRAGRTDYPVLSTPFGWKSFAVRSVVSIVSCLLQFPSGSRFGSDKRRVN